MTILDSESLRFWESVGEVGFCLVIVGVLGEGAEIVVKLFRQELYKRKQLRFDLFAAVCWVILVVGLAVEFWGNHKAMRIAAKESDRLNVEAGHARELAGEANERAASNELARVELEAKIKQAEIRTLNKTPGRMRVVTASAFAVIHLGTNSVSTNRFGGTGWTSILRFSGTNGTRFSKTPFLGMVSEQLLWWGPASNLSIPLQFSWKQGTPFNEISAPDEPADELINELARFALQPSFIFSNTKILGGTVTLVLNGSVSRTFSIPPQAFFLVRTNDVNGQLEEHLEINNFSTSEAVVELKYQ